MKANFLFVGLNPHTNVLEKTPEICTFHGWCFKNKEHQKYLKVETRLLFSPALIKFLATRLGSTTSIYQKILWFVFDLIYVVIVSSSILYLLKMTKFGLIITILT